MAKKLEKNSKLSDELVDIATTEIQKVLGNKNLFDNSKELTTEIDISDSFKNLMRKVKKSIDSKLSKENKTLLDLKNQVDIDNPLTIDNIDRTERRIKKLDEANSIVSKLHNSRVSTENSKQVPLSIEYESGKAKVVTKKEIFKLLFYVLEAKARTLTYAAYISLLSKENAVVKSNTDRKLEVAGFLSALGYQNNISIPIKTANAAEEILNSDIKHSEDDKTKTIRELSVLLSKELKTGNKSDNYVKKMNLGKAISSIFTDASSAAIEQIVKEVKDIEGNKAVEEENALDIVSGNEILYYYNMMNNLYVEKLPGQLSSENTRNRIKGGTLMSSCLRGSNSYKGLSIYSENPDKIKMLILRSSVPTKILGRVLLWYSEDGNVYADRIYSISDKCESIIRGYIKRNGIIGIHPSSYSTDGNSSIVILKDIKYGRIQHGTGLPYMDSLSMRHLYVKKGNKLRLVLSNGSTDKVAKQLIKDENVERISGISGGLKVDKKYRYKLSRDSSVISYYRKRKDNDSDDEELIKMAKVASGDEPTDSNNKLMLLESKMKSTARTRFGIGYSFNGNIKRSVRYSVIKSVEMTITDTLDLMTLGPYEVAKKKKEKVVTLEEAVKKHTKDICLIKLNKDTILSYNKVVEKLLLNEVDFIITDNSVFDYSRRHGVNNGYSENSKFDYIALSKGSVHKVFGKNNLTKLSDIVYEANKP